MRFHQADHHRAPPHDFLPVLCLYDLVVSSCVRFEGLGVLIITLTLKPALQIYGVIKQIVLYHLQRHHPHLLLLLLLLSIFVSFFLFSLLSAVVVLIITPTRELALQISGFIKQIMFYHTQRHHHHHPLFALLFLSPCFSSLSGVGVLIITPTRDLVLQISEVIKQIILYHTHHPDFSSSCFLFSVLFCLSCFLCVLLLVSGVGVLIITPTRELALQIYGVIKQLMIYHTQTHGIVIGGVNRSSEALRLMKGINLLVGTPGRILDHMKVKQQREEGKRQDDRGRVRRMCQSVE